MADLYFNRVPSPPATDDGSARPLAEDLSTGSIASNCERLGVFIGGALADSALPASGDPLYRGLEPVKHVSELA
jgi:hypothetical protein